jgi:hypothetical protein
LVRSFTGDGYRLVFSRLSLMTNGHDWAARGSLSDPTMWNSQQTGEYMQRFSGDGWRRTGVTILAHGS